MTSDQASAAALSIDAVVSRLHELEVVLGAHVRPALDAVRAALLEAIAARDRGNTSESMRKIGDAMDRLAGLADQLDPAEATMMRALSHGFRNALLRGDQSEARRSADAMLKRSGAKKIEPHS